MSKKARPTHLLEFTVENYRSIREPVTLSLLATPLHDKSTDFSLHTGKRKGLRSAVLYGPNASGKSTVMRALFLFHHTVTGHNKLFEIESVEPFLLDDSSRVKPTTFEACFEYNKQLYIYGFQLSSNDRVIVKEWLKATTGTNGRLITIYERRHDTVEVNKNLALAEHGISRAFTRQLRSQELFITTIAQNATWSLAQDVVQAWKNCGVMNTLAHNPIDGVANALLESPDTKDVLLPLLQQADINVSDITVTKNDAGEFTIKLGHTYVTTRSAKTAYFDLYEQESAGTLKFFSFALPLLNSLKDGTLMALDELGDTLHPDLLRFIIRLFNDPKRNPHNAQLVITTHDTSLMKELFARDQIYFTKKTSAQATDLYRLSDIKGIRKDFKNLDERYLNGDFGAVPVIIED